MLISSILHTLKSLFWALMLLVLIIYVPFGKRKPSFSRAQRHLEWSDLVDFMRREAVVSLRPSILVASRSSVGVERRGSRCSLRKRYTIISWSSSPRGG